MSELVTQMKLREWLIAQVDSGRYPGLHWENAEKTIFRIPWKHAAKQDYRENEDAALFKAWAVYKRKHREGSDKADPSTWKTRLRCALNKSTDFEEIPERSQLDISEPYKVYQVLNEQPIKSEESPKEHIHTREQRPQQPPVILEAPGRPHVPDRIRFEPRNEVQAISVLEKDKTDKPPGLGWTSPELPAPRMPSEPLDYGCRVRGPAYDWTAVSKSANPCERYSFLSKSRNISDFWLHIRLYYRDVLVKEFTTRTVEGCRITHQLTPADDEHLYGPSCIEQLPFPSPRAMSVCGFPDFILVLERLLSHLDRGVLLWVAGEGVFAKRQCQGRVYWSGPMAPSKDQPNKLEREKTYKLLDTMQFLKELRDFMKNGKPAPKYQIQLCFGEEFPETTQQNTKKLITAHVEPVFARELFRHAQQIDPQLLHYGAKPGESSAPDSIIKILRELYHS
ncbi:interferon regulatory factor 4-like isoform X3 [Lissotriton helveticus]